MIVACGGKAYPSLGSDGSLYSAILGLGHRLHPILPALAPVTADMRKLKGLQGVRLDADISLTLGGRLIGKTFGNIIFTDWGLNGPGVMDLSYLISGSPGKDLVLELNLLHQYEAKMQALFKDRISDPICRFWWPSNLCCHLKWPSHILDTLGVQPETLLIQIETGTIHCSDEVDDPIQAHGDRYSRI